MNRSERVFYWVGVALCLGLALSLGAGTPGVRAQSDKPASSLSFRLSLLAEPGLAVQDVSAQDKMLNLPTSGPGSLIRGPDGQVLVYVHLLEISGASKQALLDAGAQIVHVAKAYRTVTAYVHPAGLAALAALDGVEHVQEALAPSVSKVVSEGDTQLRASEARTAWSLDGSGVMVGVLSDSYAQVTSPTSAISDVLSSDLPGTGNPEGHTTPIVVTDEYTGTDATDEGRAMLQIVHDLAPGADLAFATASDGFYAFADNIRRLRNEAGADIIVDDVGYFAEPFFQDGPISVAIQDVTSSGAIYLTAAGNSHTEVGGEAIGSYEAAAYRGTTACPIAIPLYAETCHDFDPGVGENSTSGFAIAAGGEIQIVLQWAEPWYGVQTDLDMWLLNSIGGIIAQSIDYNVGGIPFETLYWLNETGSPQTVSLVIGHDVGLTPRLKYILVSAWGIGAVEWSPSTNSVDTFGPTIWGHPGAKEAISVGAIPYNDDDTPEDFSSRGYVTAYYGPVVGTSPAAALSAAEVRYKPDVAATDGGANTFFGSFDGLDYRFYGTSAAAPHAAGVAALMKERANQRGVGLGCGLAETILEDTAATMLNGSPEASGAGRIDAMEAITGVNSIESIFVPLATRNN